MIKGKVSKTVDRSTWAEYGDGFEVEIAYVTQEQVRQMRQKCLTRSWDPKTHKMTEDLDNRKFYEEFARGAVKNWRGLTGDKLRGMVPMDDYPSGDIPFSIEDAAELMLNCQSFDNFVTLMAGELEAHEAARKAAELKNSQPSPADS